MLSDVPSARPRPAARIGTSALVVWGLASIAVLVGLALWQDDGYWEYSDGVYALTARLIADGQRLYRDVAAAQPPPVYLVGALALTAADSLTMLRAALAAFELATSALVLVAVWRLTGSRVAAVVAALALLVAPWSLREHAQLIPETLAAPLLLGAAVAASRARTAVLAGILGALATACKLAFGLPALAIALAPRLRRERLRALGGLAATGAALALLSLLVYGDGLLDGAVRAQRESGTAAASYVAGLWAQGAWNLLPLLACAALAWPLRAQLEDRELARTLAIGSAGTLLLFVTLFKDGSYLTIVVVVEPFLICLGAAGVCATVRGGSRALTTVAGGALLLCALQVGSLLISPGNPELFVRPLAASGPARELSPAEVHAAVARIRACPPATPVSGPPFLAFAAGRRVPGDQPDQFILAQGSTALERFQARAAADQPRCP
jgi:hypothetical protein